MPGQESLNSQLLYDALEACLSVIEAGGDAQKAVESFPGLEAELRPVVEAALVARERRIEAVPGDVYHRVRTRSLVRAQELRERPGTFLDWLSLLFARPVFVRAIGVLVVLILSMSTLVVASAQSLPGDQLYTVKRTVETIRLNLTANIDAKQSLERVYQNRRVDELERLLALSRASEIDFMGVVMELSDETWTIGDFNVRVTPQTRVVGEILVGRFVEIHGRVLADGEIVADTVFLRMYAFKGLLVEKNPDFWMVDDTRVDILSTSQVAPNIEPGHQVLVLARSDDEGNISARAIFLADEGSSPLLAPTQTLTQTFTATASATQTPSATTTPQPTDEDDDDSGPGGDDGPDDGGDDGPDDGGDDGPDDGGDDGPDEDGDDNSGPGGGDGPDEDGDGDNSGPGGGGDDDETPEPTRTEEPDDTDEPDETEEPTRTPRPTRTEEPGD